MMVDFHSHILPGVDDGSQSLAESVAMLELERAQGMEVVAATPHFHGDRETLEAFLDRRDRAERLLRREIQDRPWLPQLLVGAEVSYFPGMCAWQGLSRLRIGQTRCILIEMPRPPWNRAVYRELEEIYRERDLIPVVAHLDRYVRPWRTYGIPEELVRLPVLVQANASFFLRRSERNLALRLLKEGKIHLLGSDCHDLEDRRPMLGSALDRIRKTDGNLLEAIAGFQSMALEESRNRRE